MDVSSLPHFFSKAIADCTFYNSTSQVTKKKAKNSRHMLENYCHEKHNETVTLSSWEISMLWSIHQKTGTRLRPSQNTLLENQKSLSLIFLKTGILQTFRM